MNLEENKEIFKLSSIGILTILTAAILVSILLPDNQTGKILKFTIPFILGIIFGAKVYFKKLEEIKRRIKK
jgi:hypothetical protein